MEKDTLESAAESGTSGEFVSVIWMMASMLAGELKTQSTFIAFVHMNRVIQSIYIREMYRKYIIFIYLYLFIILGDFF